MEIQLSKVNFKDKAILRNLLSEYLIEMNIADDYPYFDEYWIDNDGIIEKDGYKTRIQTFKS